MEKSESTQTQKSKLRRRIGKIILYLGVLLLLSIVIVKLGIMLVNAYSGSNTLLFATNDVVIIIIPISLFLILIGLVMILIPEGFTSHGIWIIKTGPYIK